MSGSIKISITRCVTVLVPVPSGSKKEITSPTFTSSGSAVLQTITSPSLIFGSIDSVNTISGTLPPMLGTLSSFTIPCTNRIQLRIKMGTRMMHSTIPTIFHTPRPLGAACSVVTGFSRFFVPGMITHPVRWQRPQRPVCAFPCASLLPTPFCTPYPLRSACKPGRYHPLPRQPQRPRLP